MKKIYIEVSCIKEKHTGIGKTITTLISTLKCLGFDVVQVPADELTKKNLIPFAVVHRFCREKMGDDDIFLIPNNMGKFWSLPHKNTWVIVHDLIPLTRYGYRGLRRFLYYYKMRSLRKANKILTISEYVKKELCEKFKISYDKVEVLYWGIDVDKEKANAHASNYFLSIGTGEPRKNVNFIIENWKYVCPQGYKLKLYGKEWETGAYENLRKLVVKYDLEDRVEILGEVTETELKSLYSMAKGFIFPSIEEGFGLPPLEALSNGCDVILPKTPVNFELYGGVANFYSLGDIKELKKQICKVDKNSDSKKNIKFCEKYNSNAFENRLFEIFQKSMGI